MIPIHGLETQDGRDAARGVTNSQGRGDEGGDQLAGASDMPASQRAKSL